MDKKKRRKIFGIKYLFYDIARIGMIPFFYLLLRTKKVFIGKKEEAKIDGKAIIVSNHVSRTDCFSIWHVFWYRRLYILTSAKTSDTNFKKNFYKLCLCIPVAGDVFMLSSFKNVLRILNDGGAIVVYPEGHIIADKNENIGNFKNGAITIALKTNTPILPVYTEKRKSIFSRVKYVVGEKFDVCKFCGNDFSKEKIEEATNQLKVIEDSLKSQYKEKFKNGKSHRSR